MPYLIIEAPAFWGFLGAFIYACPRASACVFAALDTDHRWVRCLIEAVVAVLIGPAAAESLEPWFAHIVHDQTQSELRAISMLIGLLANPASPGIVSALSLRLIRKLGG